MNKINTNTQITKLTAMALLAGLSVVSVMTIHFPIPPFPPFLEYDAADIFILIAGLIFGWSAGLQVLLVAALVQALTVSVASGYVGFIMHIVTTAALLIVSCLLREKVFKNKAWGLPVSFVFGVIALCAVAVPTNLIAQPLFNGVPIEAVTPMILPTILPFNAIKGGANAALACILFMALLPILKKTPMAQFLVQQKKSPAELQRTKAVSTVCYGLILWALQILIGAKGLPAITVNGVSTDSLEGIAGTVFYFASFALGVIGTGFLTAGVVAIKNGLRE